mmetsp:Transcript_48698/g.90283  ORF Transcript_48698/g.90283 Transcript_48698/m.90283 type:complete len:1219 (-) Transcript_48698:123-3779(-)
MASISMGFRTALVGRNLPCSLRSAALHKRCPQGLVALSPSLAGGPFRDSCRFQVSLAAVLDNAANVLPCYALVQRQLQPEVKEEPRRSEEAAQSFVHGISWTWDGKEIVLEGSGGSKRSAKNEAARNVLRRLAQEESQVMDPTQNGALAQWAIEWINRRLQASMEVQEEAVDDEEMGEESFGQASRTSNHICHWSCPQVEGEIVARGSAESAAESRRQVMSALYKDLPASLDQVIEKLGGKSEVRPQQSAAAEESLSKINVWHNEVVQQLGIKSQHTLKRLPAGDFECTLKWHFYDEKLMAPRLEESTGTGRSKAIAKGKANEKMLISQGHLPNLDADFKQVVAEVKQHLAEGRVRDAVPPAVSLMEKTAPDASGWLFFLPEVLRGVLAEGDSFGLTQLLSTAHQGLQEKGAPVELWEALLDEASYAIRHYYAAGSAMEQLAQFPLADASFPGALEKDYFQRFRHLLALERHGGLMHGIQTYELDPHMFCSVPTVDVHSMQADKVVLTSLPESGNFEMALGARQLKGSDLVLLVPLEALPDLGTPEALGDEVHRSANWQHPEAWLACVSSVKGNAHLGEEIKINTRRISRFGSDADGMREEASSSPISLGRQYRLFFVAMETPTSRMLAALRCLCKVQLPPWSDGFEGRKPSFHYNEELRQVLLGMPGDAQSRAVAPVRTVPGAESPQSVMQNVAARRPWIAALTPSQRGAVQNAIEQRLSIIQGPPGTGKTHVACAIISAWVERYCRIGERVLAVADSNVAADNLHNRLETFGIDSVRVGMGKETSTIVGDQLWQAVRTAQVVIATCIGSGMEMLESLGQARNFPRVVIDECTQACEPAALVALGKSAEQVVLIGDHNQLPATVLSKTAQREGLGVSLFERMVTNNGVEPTVLVEQRRMHSSIAEFPSQTFYQGKLVNAVDDESLPPIPGFPWPNPECRVCFVDVSSPESVEQKRGFSSYNVFEAEAVAQSLRGILDAGFDPRDLCVLTAYLAQRDEIRRAVADQGFGRDQQALSIDTVDGYQGMERDLVMFSATRSNEMRALGFLSDARRMNVMLTRARRGIIVFGHGDTLRYSEAADSNWRAWLDWVESKGAVVSATSLSLAPSTSIDSGASGIDTFSQHAANESTSMGFSGSRTADVDFHHGQTTAGFAEMPLSRESASGGQRSQLDQLPTPPSPPMSSPQWEKVYSEQYSRHYYWNKVTNQTQWEAPPDFASV